MLFSSSLLKPALECMAAWKAFSILDKDGSGVVTTMEMGQTYDVSQNPAVKSGKASPC